MSNMQAIILAAGESSRFWPLNTKHKSLVKIVGKPIIQHAIDGLKTAGVGEIIIVQGPDKSIEKNLGAVEGVNYVVQPEAKGMGNALLYAEKFITGPFFVLNAERFDSEQMVKALSEKARETGAKMILPVCKTEKPWLYGIISAMEDRAADLTEKPEKGKEPSNLKLIAAYLLPKEFFDYYRRVAEHMYAYEDALRLYMKENDARLVFFESETPSLKYSWDLFWAKKNLHAGMKKKISPAAQIHPSAVIDGDVHIGDGTRVFEHAVIRGPTYIGKNCIIGNNVLIRDSNIEDNSIVGANADMRNCIVLDGSHTHAGFFGDTILGENCRVGTGFTAANRRIDRGEIKPVVKGKKIETGATFLGAVIGDNTHIGVHVSAMPGVLIGANCMIGPATLVAENLEDATTFYTKFEKVVKKNNGGAGG